MSICLNERGKHLGPCCLRHIGTGRKTLSLATLWNVIGFASLSLQVKGFFQTQYGLWHIDVMLGKLLRRSGKQSKDRRRKHGAITANY